MSWIHLHNFFSVKSIRTRCHITFLPVQCFYMCFICFLEFMSHKHKNNRLLLLLFGIVIIIYTDIFLFPSLGGTAEVFKVYGLGTLRLPLHCLSKCDIVFLTSSIIISFSIFHNDLSYVFLSHTTAWIYQPDWYMFLLWNPCCKWISVNKSNMLSCLSAECLPSALDISSALYCCRHKITLEREAHIN